MSKEMSKLEIVERVAVTCAAIAAVFSAVTYIYEAEDRRRDRAATFVSVVRDCLEVVHIDDKTIKPGEKTGKYDNWVKALGTSCTVIFANDPLETR